MEKKLPGFKTAQSDFLDTVNSRAAFKQSVKSGYENTATLQPSCAEGLSLKGRYSM